MSNPENVAAQAPSPGHAPVRVLMVCLGNICRSPTAQGVLEQRVQDAGLADRIQVGWPARTAATSARRPTRAQQHARGHGYELDRERARQLTLDRTKISSQ